MPICLIWHRPLWVVPWPGAHWACHVARTARDCLLNIVPTGEQCINEVTFLHLVGRLLDLCILEEFPQPGDWQGAQLCTAADNPHTRAAKHCELQLIAFDASLHCDAEVVSEVPQLTSCEACDVRQTIPQVPCRRFEVQLAHGTCWTVAVPLTETSLVKGMEAGWPAATLANLQAL